MYPEMENTNNDIYAKELKDNEFQKLSNFINTEYGIKLPPEKKVMLQSRLQKRLKKLNIPDFKQYIEYVFSNEGKEKELIHMIDVVTTNKTDFFREAQHFRMLLEQILPGIMQGRNYYMLKAWSAGCASGEEPYTMAMTFSEFARNNPNFDYQIYATDVSTQMLQTGVNGVYQEQKAEVIPVSLKKRYVLRSKDKSKKLIRIGPNIREKVKFGRLNLIDDYYNINENYDIIFCRNTLIYFYRKIQENIINKLMKHLNPGGYFFIGHSESIMNMDVPLKQIESTVYQKI